MKLVSFSILTALSLLYAGLTFAEGALYRNWENAMMEQKELQQKISFFQQLNGYLEALLKRTAIDSQHDPALAELLKQNQIKVLVTPVQSSGDEPTATVSPAPAAESSPATPNQGAKPSPQ